jgi:hypothetical protein
MQSWQKCWFARNLAETYLQLSKKMKIWLAGSTLNKEGLPRKTEKWGKGSVETGKKGKCVREPDEQMS